MKKITPFLWFDDKAEEAARFYTSIFADSEILETRRYAAGGPGKAGSVMSVTFRLEDETFVALNGGPHFAFTPAISFFVECRDQGEVDTLWGKLLEGGAPSQCGWLTDRYGLSWQIVPKRLSELMQDGDCDRASRVMQAMLKMIKLDVAGLERAYAKN